MRFLSMAWWSGDTEEDRSAQYRQHFASIRHRLPPQLIHLEESVALHDSRLRELTLDVSTRTLRLRVENYEGTHTTTLVYGAVVSFDSVADPAVGLRGPHGYGDLGYDEVDVLADGVYEHRILFSTGIELVIRFGEVAVSVEPLPPPVGPH